MSESMDVLIVEYSFMEGARLRSSVRLPREVAKEATVKDHNKKVDLKPGQRVLCNLVRYVDAGSYYIIRLVCYVDVSDMKEKDR
jgi:hypothetical protein